MNKTELGLLFVIAAAVFLIACGEPPPRNVSAPPPAPTSAPIANINANDLKKMRRTNESTSSAPANTAVTGKETSPAAADSAPGPKTSNVREGEEKKIGDADADDK